MNQDQEKLDSASVQRLALSVLATLSISRWARPSERMLSDIEVLERDHRVNPVLWARQAFRTKGVSA